MNELRTKLYIEMKSTTYEFGQEYIRKDKRKESSEANSAWEVAKLAVFKQPAWDQSDCSKIMHFWQQMAQVWCLNPQFTLVFGALFIQFLELLTKFFCARSWFFFEFGASDGFIWSEISQGFQKYSNFVCRTKIDGVIDKKPDFIFDSSLTTAVFTHNKNTMVKNLKILSKNYDSFLPSKSVKFWLKFIQIISKS